MEAEKNIPQLNPDYIVQINGKSFVKYAGLLEEVEDRGGLTRLDVEVIQFPAEVNGNTAVCLAKVEMDGKFYSDIGEASIKTLNPQVADYLLSMASTRAKGRALRNAISVGICCLEEIRSFNDVVSEEPLPEKKPVQTKSTTQPTTQPPTQSPAKSKSSSTNTELKLITPAQEKAIIGMAKRQNIDPAKLCEEMFNAKLKMLPRQDASKVIEHLKATAS